MDKRLAVPAGKRSPIISQLHRRSMRLGSAPGCTACLAELETEFCRKNCKDPERFLVRSVSTKLCCLLQWEYCWASCSFSSFQCLCISITGKSLGWEKSLLYLCCVSMMLMLKMHLFLWKKMYWICRKSLGSNQGKRPAGIFFGVALVFAAVKLMGRGWQC